MLARVDVVERSAIGQLQSNAVDPGMVLEVAQDFAHASVLSIGYSIFIEHKHRLVGNQRFGENAAQ